MNAYKKLEPFKMWCLNNFPYIEETFQELNYYELLSKIVEYLNTTLDNVDGIHDDFITLHDYVDHYFDNLDVQEEINNKLDAMSQDGTLENLFHSYIDSEMNEYKTVINATVSGINNNINTFESNVNNSINNFSQSIESIQSNVESITSGSPAGVYATLAALQSADPDHSKIYIVEADGEWYFWNNSTNQWKNGGVYQATSIGTKTVKLDNLDDNIINNRYKHSSDNYNLFNPFECIDNKGLRSSDGVIVDNNSYYLSNKILIPAGKSIKILKSIDFKDDTGATDNVYKTCIYNTNDEFIESTQGLNFYHNDNEFDVYMILQIIKTHLTFERRFEFLIFLSDLTEDAEQWIFKQFIPYMETNNDNILLNVKEKDLSLNIQKRVGGIPDIKVELGLITGATGTTSSASNRIRSKTYHYFKKGTVVKALDNDVTFNIFKYNTDYTYIGYTNWQNNYTFDDDYYCRITFKYNDNRNMSADEINTLFEKFKFISPEDNILNILENNNIIYPNESIEYFGEKIDLKNRFNYKTAGFNAYGQDSCSYNEFVFNFNSSGKFKVYDLINKTLSSEFQLNQYATIKPHCNCCFFSNEKFTSIDDFPMMYVNAYNTSGLPRGTLYAHRVIKEGSTYSTELKQTITIGFTTDPIWTIDGDIRFYGNFLLDTDNNYLYAYTLRGNKTRFFKFNMPSVNDGESITLNISDIIEYFDVDYYPYIQGGLYNNGKLFVLAGNNSIVANSSVLKVIDLVKKQETSSVPLSALMNEPEAIILYNNELYIGQSAFYKIKF